MKKMMSLTFVAVLAITMCAGCGDGGGDGTPAAPKPKNLKLGHSLDIEHPVHVSLVKMGELLAEKSGGMMTIDVYPSEQLGSERDMIQSVQSGLIAMVKTSTAPLEGFVPIMGVFSVPYVFRDSEHYWKVLDGPIGQRICESSVGVSLRGLCYYDSGARSFYTKEKPILQPSDLAGMKIRVMQSETSMAMITAMGGSPTPIAWGELYTSLQQGVVDGAENNPPSYQTSRHYEVCKHYSLDEHTRTPDIILISEKVWQTLTPEEQTMLQEAANESSVFQRELWKVKTQEALDIVEEAGATIYRPDVAPFQKQVEEMHKSYDEAEDEDKKAIGQLIKEIQAVN